MLPSVHCDKMVNVWPTNIHQGAISANIHQGAVSANIHQRAVSANIHQGAVSAHTADARFIQKAQKAENVFSFPHVCITFVSSSSWLTLVIIFRGLKHHEFHV